MKQEKKLDLTDLARKIHEEHDLSCVVLFDRYYNGTFVDDYRPGKDYTMEEISKIKSDTASGVAQVLVDLVQNNEQLDDLIHHIRTCYLMKVIGMTMTTTGAPN